MKYKGIIFDLDGTLLNTLDDIANAANLTLKQHGLPIYKVDDYKQFVGKGLAILIHDIVPKEMRTTKKLDMYVETFRQIYGKTWDATTHVYKGINRMLFELNNKKIKLAILSNKPDNFTKICVDKYLNNIEFDQILGARDGVARKPDPAGALEIANNWQLKPDNILFVGDSSTDMQTGKNANMDTLGVLWGFRDRQELEENGACVIVNHPSEIVDYVTTA